MTKKEMRQMRAKERTETKAAEIEKLRLKNPSDLSTEEKVILLVADLVVAEAELSAVTAELNGLLLRRDESDSTKNVRVDEKVEKVLNRCVCAFCGQPVPDAKIILPWSVGADLITLNSSGKRQFPSDPEQLVRAMSDEDVIRCTICDRHAAEAELWLSDFNQNAHVSQRRTHSAKTAIKHWAWQQLELEMAEAAGREKTFRSEKRRLETKVQKIKSQIGTLEVILGKKRRVSAEEHQEAQSPVAAAFQALRAAQTQGQDLAA